MESRSTAQVSDTIPALADWMRSCWEKIMFPAKLAPTMMATVRRMIFPTWGRSDFRMGNVVTIFTPSCCHIFVPMPWRRQLWARVAFGRHTRLDSWMPV